MSGRLIFSVVVSTLALGSMLLPSCKRKVDATIESTNTNYTLQDKRIYFIYGSLIRSVSVSDLEKFASRGVANGDIGNIIKFGKLDAKALRAQLNKEYQLDFVETSKILNNQFGVAVLNKLGDAVHPHLTKTASVQAVRSAIVMSLQDDNKLTPLEVLKNLPVDMDVEVDVVLKMRDELSALFAKG